MKKLLLSCLAATACCVFIAICGCDDSGYDIPTKTGGGGKQQPYVPAGNKGSGGRYMHVNTK